MSHIFLWERWLGNLGGFCPNLRAQHAFSFCLECNTLVMLKHAEVECIEKSLFQFCLGDVYILACVFRLPICLRGGAGILTFGSAWLVRAGLGLSPGSYLARAGQY